MKIYKEINIDLETERNRIKKCKYTKKQKEKLLNLVDIFETGQFKKCYDYIRANFTIYSKRDKCYETEYINDQIYTIVFQVGIFDYNYLAETDLALR
jgi:hypothetical protein